MFKFFPSVRLKILFFSRSFKKDHVINIQFSKIIFSFQKSYDSWKLNRNLTSIFLFRYATFRSVFLLRKEVIHPHVPVGIPCYDLTPIISPTLGMRLLSVTYMTSGIANSHGLTGGVYKARERIHRDMLIRDY